jgi:hypothetical protein
MLNSSGFVCVSDLSDATAPYLCESTLSSPLIVPFFSAPYPGGDFDFVKSTLVTQTSVLAYAFAVVVKYKADDITQFPGSVATTLKGATATKTTSITTIATTPIPIPPTTKEERPSIGTKIAIGVAVPIAVLSLVAVIATIYFFRRRSHQPVAAPAMPAPVVQYVVAAPPGLLPPGPQLDGKPVYYYQPPAPPPQGPPVPLAFQGSPAPGYHEMAYGQGLGLGLGYPDTGQDGVRS